jgi:cell division protein FtsX
MLRSALLTRSAFKEERRMAIMTRRMFITTAAATGLGAIGVLTFHSFSKGRADYEQAVKQI